MAEKNTGLATKEVGASERFMLKVMNEFESAVSSKIQLSDYSKSLAQGYFIGIDRALKVAEEKREGKNKSNSNHDWDNKTPYTWANVNLEELSKDVVHYARMGLDMMQPNHISPIPFLNKKTNQYDVNLMPGYSGIEYVANKYALDPPVSVTTEVVYSTDIFNPIKKSVENKIENYTFEITSAFSRGEIIGAFGYIEFSDSSKNKLIIMSMKDINKRKPQHASAEFWGGTKTVWESGKKVEVQTDGWIDEMVLKTIKREVYGTKNIPVDPKKVDDDYQYMKIKEAATAELIAQEMIDAEANSIPLEIDEGTGEVTEPAVDELP